MGNTAGGDGGGDLVDFVAKVAGGELRVEENLGEGYVRLRVEEAERRQAAHDIRYVEDAIVEMMRNSRDAGAHHIYVATTREGDLRTTTVIDDGIGIPADMQERVFDARVTSKLESMKMDRWGVHGRGMALYSVRMNTKSAQVVQSGVGKGAAIQIVSDATKLAERADQSTWPSVGVDDDGEMSVVRGPHNIIRACADFALEERGMCEVFLGSPAEIAATARAREKANVRGTDLLFLDDLGELPILERFNAAADARELMDVAASAGLTLSERTVHRILAGQIKPLRGVYARLTHAGQAQGEGRPIDLDADRRGLKLSKEDTEEFSRIMERDFAWLASRYYLELGGSPKVTARGGKVTVTFPLIHDD